LVKSSSIGRSERQVQKGDAGSRIVCADSLNTVLVASGLKYSDYDTLFEFEHIDLLKATHACFLRKVSTPWPGLSVITDSARAADVKTDKEVYLHPSSGMGNRTPDRQRHTL
jgi:hypothetical protein